MKYLPILGIALLSTIVSCKKSDFSFDKFSDTQIKPEVLTPLASARVLASNLFQQDSIIQYDPDGLIRLTYKQDSVFEMNADEILKDVSLGKSSSKFSIGELTITGADKNSDVTLSDLLVDASANDRDYINSIAGTTDTFPAFSSDEISMTVLPKSTDYEYLNLSKGHLVFTVRNGFPTVLKALQINIYDKAGSGSPVLLGTVSFSNVPANAVRKDSINVANRTLTNILGYAVPVADISKSSGPVLIDLNDKIDINVSYSNLKCVGGKAILPAQTIPTKTLSIDLSDPSTAAMLRNVEFGTAILPIKTTSSINTTVSIGISLPDATRSGNPISTLQINAPTGNTSSEIDLSGANIFLGSNPVKDFNMLRLRVNTNIKASSGLVLFDSSDNINIEFNASTAKFEYIDGYLGKDTFDISIDGLDVSQLAELGGGIRMENPKMHIFVNNSFGIPFLVELDITARDEKGKKLPMNVQDMLFPNPSIAERGTVKTAEFEINKSNSDIVECLGMPATVFDIKGRAIMNPNGFTGYSNHITKSSAIDLGFDADIPMTFTAKNFAYIDTLDQGNILQNLSDFDLLELKVKSSNGFPFGGTIDLIFADANYKPIDSLVKVTLVKSAVVNQNGDITQNGENMSSFMMPGSMLDLLSTKKCEYIIIRTNFNSYDDGKVPVSIYTSCALDVSLAIRAIYTSDL